MNVVQMRRRRARFSIILAGYPILQGLSAGDPSDCPETHLTGRRPIRLAGDPLGGRKLLHRWPEMSQFLRVSAYMTYVRIIITFHRGGKRAVYSVLVKYVIFEKISSDPRKYRCKLALAIDIGRRRDPVLDTDFGYFGKLTIKSDFVVLRWILGEM